MGAHPCDLWQKFAPSRELYGPGSGGGEYEGAFGGGAGLKTRELPSTMKANLPVIAVLALLWAGCSTVDSRIAKNRAEFSSWPAAVQDKVVAGKIDLGFTPEQVLMALGEPDRRFTRTSTDGTTAVWSYRDRGPQISFGLGLGLGGRRSAGFGGVVLGPGYQDDEQMGIVFDRTGKVSAIETRQR